LWFFVYNTNMKIFQENKFIRIFLYFPTLAIGFLFAYSFSILLIGLFIYLLFLIIFKHIYFSILLFLLFPLFYAFRIFSASNETILNQIKNNTPIFLYRFIVIFLYISSFLIYYLFAKDLYASFSNMFLNTEQSLKYSFYFSFLLILFFEFLNKRFPKKL